MAIIYYTVATVGLVTALLSRLWVNVAFNIGKLVLNLWQNLNFPTGES